MPLRLEPCTYCIEKLSYSARIPLPILISGPSSEQKFGDLSSLPYPRPCEEKKFPAQVYSPC